MDTGYVSRNNRESEKYAMEQHDRNDRQNYVLLVRYISDTVNATYITAYHFLQDQVETRQKAYRKLLLT